MRRFINSSKYFTSRAACIRFNEYPEDNSLSMPKSLELGTVMPIYCHFALREIVVLIRGKICWHFYDDSGFNER